MSELHSDRSSPLSSAPSTPTMARLCDLAQAASDTRPSPNSLLHAPGGPFFLGDDGELNYDPDAFLDASLDLWLPEPKPEMTRLGLGSDGAADGNCSRAAPMLPFALLQHVNARPPPAAKSAASDWIAPGAAQAASGTGGSSATVTSSSGMMKFSSRGSGADGEAAASSQPAAECGSAFFNLEPMETAEERTVHPAPHTIRQDIVALAPEWASLSGGTLVLIVGPWEAQTEDYTVRIGTGVVPARQLQTGVLACHTPPMPHSYNTSLEVKWRRGEERMRHPLDDCC